MSDNIEELLVKLRDNPADNSSATEQVLARVFKHLTTAPEDSNGRTHWFCSQAQPSIVGSASFLLRLYGFNGDSVNIWKAGFRRCITNCCSCAQQLEEIKMSSRSTYFGAYGSDILQKFFEKFQEWELSMVLEDLKDNGFSTDGSSPLDGKTLSDAPPTLLYRMVVNWKTFSDSRVQNLLNTCPPRTIAPDWPSSPRYPPPPGMLGLLMAKSPTLRDWARNQSFTSKPTCMSLAQFTESYTSALLAMAAVVNSPSYSTTGALILSDDPAAVWAAFGTMLQMIPVEHLTSNRLQSIDLRHIVAGHLHDTGTHFLDVLRSFHLLLKRLSQKFWAGAEPEYPKVVFDSVKDNPAFLAVLQDVHLSGDRRWTLLWIQEFLYTLQNQAVYGDVFAKTIDFLCEELQHERFEAARPTIMHSALSLLNSVLRKCESEKDFRHKDSFFNTLDIHSNTLVAVAFGRGHTAESWTSARTEVRTLIRHLLQADIQKILSTIMATVGTLYQLKKGVDTPAPIPALSIRKQLWASVYGTIDSKDTVGLATVIVAVAQAAHIANVIKEPYKGIEAVKAAERGFISGDKVIDQINDALESVQNGFLTAVSRFADYSVSSSALEVLRQPGVGRAVVLLLLSPVQDLQTAATTIIGLAFDEDVRADCFRAMFVNMPDATFDGVIDFLTEFNEYAAKTPEATAASRSLVRCFNDILDVLCSSPEGLLLQDRFLRPTDVKGPTSRLLEFWKALTRALTTIFKRTVVWAAYYKSKDMVEWMRDAVILGRDTIKQWRVIESAANGRGSPTAAGGKSMTKQHSGVRTKMIACFQDMLPEMAKWLRLTDEELLYQAFAIVRNLLEVFRETGVRPLDVTLGKLSKYVADARADGKAKSRLDASSLVKLEDALAAFDESSSASSSSSEDDDDDEVQIVGHTKPRKVQQQKKDVAPVFVKKEKKDKARAREEEPPARKHYIQSVSSSSKSGDSIKGKNVQTRLFPEIPRKSTGALYRSLKESEKAKLEEPAAFPSFKRGSTSTTSTASSSTKPMPRPRGNEPKNEALAARIDSESSSSSSSSDDDDQPQVDLSALGQRKKPKSPKIRKQERRQIKTLDIPFGKSAIAERMKNRSKPQYSSSLRLRPDISSLHKTILSWKYDHDGALPPGTNLQLNQVPGEFGDYNHYRRVFEPLLLLECWSQIIRSKEEKPDSYLAKISSKQYVSDWLDIDLALIDNPPRDWDLAQETDIILLAAPDNSKKIMAKTLFYKKNPMAMVVTARCFLPHGVDPGLMQGSEWRISKIYSLSTINREYGALVAAPYLDCFQRILSSQLERIPYIDSAEVQSAMTSLKLNKPQATAVVGAMKTDGFVLIQGPPGTGKTSTICGLVSRFITLRATPINVPEKDAPPKAKILICAPSNAAIDEIASRLVSATKKINVVRTGSDFQIGVAVKSVSLDQLVKNKIAVKTGLQGTSIEDSDREIKALLVEMDSLKHLREAKMKEIENDKENLQHRSKLEQEAQRLRTKRQELGNRLTALRDKIKSEHRNMDGLRRQMRREVLLEADVVCCTLSGSGHEALIDIDFEMVIIDEAAQSIELSSLIPMKFNSKRCVLVGDPQQLPPTVISQEATRRRYDQSLFLRLFNKNPQAIHLLSIQYRMHPDISRFPSKAFYENRIEDGPDMSTLTSRPWHTQPMFGTYKFFNVAGQEEAGSFNSIKNTSEVQIAKAIYQRLSREFKATGFTRRVGIVSMYRAQISELKRQFFQAFGESILENVDFNTVDGFQGQEKDIIILSCVRAGPGLRSIGFLADVRRLNVAITRAKSSLFILGNAPTLERSDETWKQVVADARDRGRLITVDVKFFQQPSTAITGVTSLSPVKKTASSGPPPVKKQRLSEPSQVVPEGLVTPQELKKLGKKISNVHLTPAASTSSSMAPPLFPAGPGPAQPVAGIKRPAEEDGPPGPSKHSKHTNVNGSGGANGTNGNLPSRPPPPKRPKQQSMFIPKKKK